MSQWIWRYVAFGHLPPSPPPPPLIVPHDAVGGGGRKGGKFGKKKRRQSPTTVFPSSFFTHSAWPEGANNNNSQTALLPPAAAAGISRTATASPLRECRYAGYATSAIVDSGGEGIVQVAIVKSHIWVLPLLPARGRGGKTFETNKNQTRHKTDSVRGGGGGKKVSSSCLSLSPSPLLPLPVIQPLPPTVQPSFPLFPVGFKGFLQRVRSWRRRRFSETKAKPR